MNVGERRAELPGAVYRGRGGPAFAARPMAGAPGDALQLQGPGAGGGTYCDSVKVSVGWGGVGWGGGEGRPAEGTAACLAWLYRVLERRPSAQKARG